MSLRLTREAKILKPGEYTHIFKGGKRAKGKYWQIIAKPILDSRPRLGLAISKKVTRLAVDRNRFKRVARETFRLAQPRLDSWGFVVMARTAKPIKNSELSTELLNLFIQVTRK